jgi:hypothetical protein
MNQPVSRFHAAHARVTYGKEEGQANYINQVAADLKEIADANVARLPEEMFREVFLPLFAGEPLKYPEQSNIAGWIGIAGSAYKEVDIFDPKTNQVLFRCPPLFDYNGINPVRNPQDRSQRPIADIVAMADQLANLHPNQGVAFLTRELGKRALTMNTSKQLAQHFIRWNAVFARYGRASLTDAAGAPAATSSTQGVVGSEPEAQYEDF